MRSLVLDKFYKGYFVKPTLVLLFMIVPLFLLTGCDYDTGTPGVTQPPTITTFRPTKTQFGPADFLVEGVANMLNTFASFLGNIGIGVLKWFISTTDTLNLTRGGDYRLCQITEFSPVTPIDPLASCSLAVYDEIKYLPAALLGVMLVYFFTRYTFQGVFSGGNRLSMFDYLGNIFLVVLVAFNLDFIVTLIIDLSSKLFLLILTVGPGSQSETQDLATIAQSLDKLVGLFNIAPIHKQDLGMALVLVIICVPAVLALMLIGIFFFTRVIFFLLYFVLGVPAVTAKLADETDFFFTAWYSGLIKLAVSSFPLAIVLRLGLEVAKVLNISDSLDPIQYIILMLIVTLLFGAGGYYAFIILRSEVRQGVATISRVGSAVSRWTGNVRASMGGGRTGAGSSSRGETQTRERAGGAGAGAGAGADRSLSAPASSSSRSIGTSGSRSPAASASSFESGSGSGNNRRAGSSATGTGLGLTPQMLTNAISTGLTQAFTAQSSKNERVAGAVLNQLSSIRVILDELKAVTQQLTRNLRQPPPSLTQGAGASYGILELPASEYRELAPDYPLAQLPVPGKRYPVSTSGGGPGNSWAGAGSGASNSAPRLRPGGGGQAGRVRAGAGAGGSPKLLRRRRIARPLPNYQHQPLHTGAGISATYPASFSAAAPTLSSGAGGANQLPLTIKNPGSGRSGTSTRARRRLKRTPHWEQPRLYSNASFPQPAEAEAEAKKPTPASRQRQAARPANPTNFATPAKPNPTGYGLGGTTPIYNETTEAVNLPPPPGFKRSWEPSVRMLLNPNTGQAYTGLHTSRLKPGRSVSPPPGAGTGTGGERSGRD